MSLPARYPYQEFMYQKILSRGKVPVMGKPGCGKTRPIIDACVALGLINLEYKDGDPRDLFPRGPIFVMCSGPAVATWYKQFPQWTDYPGLKDYVHVVTGDLDSRKRGWRKALNTPGIYITNFACFRLDFHMIKQVRWAAPIADEYHKVMRRRQSDTWNKWRSWTRHMEIAIIATGSIVSKEPGSMWTAFAFAEPSLKLFRSYWRYMKTFCNIVDGMYGQEMIGLKNVGRLKELMDRYFAYVPKEVIADQLPEGHRVVLDVIINDEQLKLYKSLQEDAIAFFESGGLIVAPTAVTKLMRLRQLLCCPKILDEGLGMGAGYDAIVDKLDEQPHCVIFVPFRPAVGYVAGDLRQKGYHVGELLGGVGAQEQINIIEAFRRHRGIIVCTIAYAESFDLETCDTSYFLGYDYNVDPNEQAEGRTQRAISEHEFVTWNYVCYHNTIDEVLRMNLNEDMANVSRILSRPKSLIRALKGEVT